MRLNRKYMSGDIENLIHEWRSNVAAHSKAKAEAVYLSEFRKSKKAILMAEAQEKGVKTGQERETYAYSHPEYLELLTAIKVSIEVSEDLRYRMIIAERRCDIWRTKAANNRKEQSAYGA